ncbi:WAP protein, partial [Syrrhaptes paradoxus]|nr:WAP protein [Syrrhaptes paradoxus]
CLTPGVAEKPGACPAAVPEGLFYPCAFACLEDRDCLGAQKCCPLPCGPACLEPVPDKPGECPRVRPRPEPCVEEEEGDSCAHDRDCPRQEKCCFSGCAMR